jgi:hypothetical protein
MGVSGGEGQDVGSGPAAPVDRSAGDAQVVEDRGEVVGMLYEAPARQTCGGAEAGAFDRYHPQPALDPGRLVGPQREA